MEQPTEECPHAAPFRYCGGRCLASPCPIELDDAGRLARARREAAARALFESEEDDNDAAGTEGPRPTWEGVQEYVRAAYRSRARVVLAAKTAVEATAKLYAHDAELVRENIRRTCSPEQAKNMLELLALVSHDRDPLAGTTAADRARTAERCMLARRAAEEARAP